MSDIINPFIAATLECLSTMMNIDGVSGEVVVPDKVVTTSEISTSISLTGETANGIATLSFSKEVAHKLINNFLGEGMVESDEELFDAVGEIINIVGGSAKAKLVKHQLKLSLPTVTSGDNISLSLPKDVPVESVSIDLPDIGELTLYVSMQI